MIFKGLDSDFGSVIAEYSSVSGVWLMSKCAVAVAEWVLAAMRWAGGAGNYPGIDPVGKNGKYEYCGLSSNISSGKYLRPIESDWIESTL